MASLAIVPYLHVLEDRLASLGSNVAACQEERQARTKGGNDPPRPSSRLRSFGLCNPLISPFSQFTSSTSGYRSLKR